MEVKIMPNAFDLSIDWLADAPLTPEQRQAWTSLRGEIASLQAKNLELTTKIRLMEEAKEDDIPALLNRPDFNREVARMLAFDERYGGISSVLYFDFDNLDEVGSRYGNSIAAAASREIAILLAQNVRSSDVLGRLAPDEYGVLLMRCDNTAAWRKAESLATQLQQALIEIQDCPLNIKVSYGAYTFRDNDDLSVGLKEVAQSLMRVVK